MTAAQRTRSALARERKRKLLEATEHASPAQDVRAIAALAAASSAAGPLLVDDGANPLAPIAIRTLRNSKNSVYHRAQATRVIGLLALRDADFRLRLRLESDELVDALLQLIHACRRHPPTSDTRRVHVNCCLVISMLMQRDGGPGGPSVVVVPLDSPLLALPARPAERASAFLLLTVGGRPETASDAGGDARSPVSPSPLLGPPRALSPPPPLPPPLPSPSPQSQPRGTAPMPMRPRRSVGPRAGDALGPGTMAQDLARRQTPTRKFKMDRFRVVTPALVEPRDRSTLASQPFPVIPPTPAFARRSNQRPDDDNGSDDDNGGGDRISSGDNEGGDVPRATSSEAPSLLSPAHMVELFRTGRMPLSAPKFFRDHPPPSSSASKGQRPPLRVIEWGEWRRQGLDSREDAEGLERHDDDGNAMTRVSPPRVTTSVPVSVSSPRGTSTSAAVADVNTPAYRRRRLREILASPVEPAPGNTAHLRDLSERGSVAVLGALGAELDGLRQGEAQLRAGMNRAIAAERERLPLRFLFQLPGGAAYCRDRMRRAMRLWVRTFEANQQRMALLQWQAVVEHARFRDRGEAYHRVAIQKRLRVAIEYVLRSYCQQALARWRGATQALVWGQRDAAARRLQRQVRRHLALLGVLRRHHARPVGGPDLRDGVYLAPHRPALAFALPRVVRDTHRRLWAAAERVQGAVRRRRFRIFLARYRRAATAIQARARMRLARAAFRLARRRITLLQAQARMRVRRRAFQALRRAAILVQGSYRGVRVRRLRRLVAYAQRRAHERHATWALALQRLARRWLARREAQRRASERDEAFHAALVVQRAWYRRNNEWSTFLLLGCLRVTEAAELAFARRLRAFERQRSAARIQRQWARYRLARRQAAALGIQCAIRRWAATRHVERRRQERMAHRRIKWFFRARHRLRHEMATRLQYWWLGAVPGRLAAHLRHRRREWERDAARAQHAREERAASRLQGLARGRRDRRHARRERSARCIQRGIRDFLARRRRARERRRVIGDWAQRAVEGDYVPVAVTRLVIGRMATLHAAAAEIQRFVRGGRWRSLLTRAMVQDEVRTRMARRIQCRWRQSAQQRAAAKLLQGQRRRLCSPFRGLPTIAAVLAALAGRLAALYDPDDDLVGLHVAEWLRRLGLHDAYGGLFAKSAWLNRPDDANDATAVPARGDSDVVDAIDAVASQDGGLRRLRADATTVTSCRERLEALGVSDDDHAQLLATSLLAKRTLDDVARLRRQLDVARRRLRDSDKRVRILEQRGVQLAAERRELEHLVDEVAGEACDFRHPPKALRDLHDELVARLRRVELAHGELQRRLDGLRRAHAADDETVQRLQRQLAQRDREEVSAVYAVHSLRVIEHLGVARGHFLESFPGLEARALAFVNALEDSAAGVTRWQLVRFFAAHKTIAAVKANMSALTAFARAAEVRKYDHRRFRACAEHYRDACERIGEILGLAIEHCVFPQLGLAATTSGGGDDDDDDRGGLLPRLVLRILDRQQRSRQQQELPQQRLQSWIEATAGLVRMNAVATRIQAQWRRRAAVRVLAALRSDRHRARLQASYLAEVRADRVTPLWRAERDRELAEYEAWARAEALAQRHARLAETLRFPFVAHWADDSQSWLYYYDGASGEYTAERPVYTLQEDDAAIRIQALGRRYVARCDLHRRQRRRRRLQGRERLARQWLALAPERAQVVTLRTTVDVVQDDRVSRWLERRPGAPASTASLAKAAPGRGPNVTSRRRPPPRHSPEPPTTRQPPPELQAALVAPAQALQHAYHRSVRTAHRGHWRLPTHLRPPDAHCAALLELVDAVEDLERVLAPAVRTHTTLRYTKAGLRFGWRESPHWHGVYEHARTRETTWERPEYAFDEEYAAVRLQSVARVLVARNHHRELLASLSLVDCVRDAVGRAAAVGWIGFGLEGLSTRAWLARLGLAKYAPALHAHAIDDLPRLADSPKLRKLGWTKDELAVLGAAPTRVRRKPPLSSALTALAPTAKHPFNFLPSERVVQQLVAQSLPNQQGRVLGLVRAIRASTTPITYRQLEMHLRLFAGRPDDALAQIGDIASLAFVTQAPEEAAIARILWAGVERCLVLAANLRLRALHEALTLAWGIAAVVAPEAPNPRRQWLPLAATVGATAIDAGVAELLAQLPRRPVKGLWEHPVPSANGDAAVVVSWAQVALFLRTEALELVLRWVRSALVTQATFRMHRARRWYRAVVAERHAAATRVQCAWRGFQALEARRLLRSQQRSEYEQGYDQLTRTFFFVYKPTQERLLEEPRDHRGDLIPYRPVIQDRVTRRWVLAWPQLERRADGDDGERDDAHGADGGVPCSVCHVERAVRRCNECYSPAGDYVDHCLACFYDRHPPEDPATNWHGFATLHQLKTRFFHCVECRRFSSMRCLRCHEHYCERCFARVHGRGHQRTRHTCEYYAPMAAVCVECEARVAFQQCLVCTDALCEDCMTRTHQRGHKARHELRLIRQPLGDAEVYCEQCRARRGDTRCRFCALALCQLCLSGDRHTLVCPETELDLRKRALLGDQVCVECGKPADRVCETCGDRYCSVRWMGNPGCFERFHHKGKRADHIFGPLTVPEMPPEIHELEEKVRIKRRRDAEAAEHEAKQLAAALVSEGDTRGAAPKAASTPTTRRRAKPPRDLGTVASRTTCSVESCTRPSLSAAVAFCARHFTSQHALEVAKLDPQEAARLLALLDKHHGRLPDPAAVTSGLARIFGGGPRHPIEKSKKM